ncbi:M20/M25/M40 family metallo-hydrolase [Derxia gummosa]|uniref:M20/M25/M40 family metallo-hydrolase n=1 Tax=Derxia gummosa DSM 723 TaxID=1121388 RepID=A0A8B6X7F1_9BURK|nr:M20/M25/M40 family metallo-hydrolase [Derxia gummosa]
MQDTLKQFIDAEFEASVAFLAELVKQPSDNPPGDCQPHAARAKALLEALGFTVEAHVVPDADVKAVGMISATNLIVRERFGDGGPTIALNAHGDVVPPGLGWSHGPYDADIVDDPVHGRVMIGRGVAVSKSDFATYTWALLALRAAAKAGLPLKGSVELHFTYDEETGGEIGPGWLLAQGLSKPDFAMSAGFTYNIVQAHNGCLHTEVTVTGKQAHAAMPHTGVDALEAATHVLQALYAHRATLAQRPSSVAGIAHPTLNIGLISGGINTNVVPDQVSFRIDRRITPDENPAEAEAELGAVIDAAARSLPVPASVSHRRILLARPLAPQPGIEKLTGAIRRHAAEVLGCEVTVGGVPIYTDARHYAERGIPTVLYGAGPRTLLEANGHNADENLRLSDLRKATEIVARACADLLG